MRLASVAFQAATMATAPRGTRIGKYGRQVNWFLGRSRSVRTATATRGVASVIRPSDKATRIGWPQLWHLTSLPTSSPMTFTGAPHDRQGSPSAIAAPMHFPHFNHWWAAQKAASRPTWFRIGNTRDSPRWLTRRAAREENRKTVEWQKWPNRPSRFGSSQRAASVCGKMGIQSPMLDSAQPTVGQALECMVGEDVAVLE